MKYELNAKMNPSVEIDETITEVVVLGDSDINEVTIKQKGDYTTPLKITLQDTLPNNLAVTFDSNVVRPLDINMFEEDQKLFITDMYDGNAENLLINGEPLTNSAKIEIASSTFYVESMKQLTVDYDRYCLCLLNKIDTESADHKLLVEVAKSNKDGWL